MWTVGHRQRSHKSAIPGELNPDARPPRSSRSGTSWSDSTFYFRAPSGLSLAAGVLPGHPRFVHVHLLLAGWIGVTIMGAMAHTWFTPIMFGATSSHPRIGGRRMPATTLDLRDVPPAERHPMIHEAFEAIDGGEVVRIVNDHDPKPLFYEFQAEVDDFDAEGYAVEQRGPGEFVADLPKQ